MNFSGLLRKHENFEMSFWCFQFFKKSTKNFCPCKLGQKLKFSSSVFERIEDIKISFWNQLTFRANVYLFHLNIDFAYHENANLEKNSPYNGHHMWPQPRLSFQCPYFFPFPSVGYRKSDLVALMLLCVSFMEPSHASFSDEIQLCACSLIKIFRWGHP